MATALTTADVRRRYPIIISTADLSRPEFDGYTQIDRLVDPIDHHYVDIARVSQTSACRFAVGRAY